jgi:hypothetical protein
MKTCIVLFSHADTESKEFILSKTLISLEKLNLPIILVSHTPVSIENQKKCDYVIFEKNNLLLKETDFFNEDIQLTESNFNTQYFFGGISTRCYIHKKTYAASVVNLYINGFSLANHLGFDYGLLWEYDFELDDKTHNNIKYILEDVVNNSYDGFFIPCQISGINSIQAVPAIFPIKKFYNYLPKKVIQTPKEYIDNINMMLSEEWIFHFYAKLDNPKTYSFNEYYNLVNIELSNQVSSGVENPLFYGLNSGIFIDKNDKSSWICSVYNDSPKIINYSYNLTFKGQKIDSFSEKIYPNYWKYSFISKDISDEILNSDEFLEIYEHINYENHDEIYEYKIHKNNVDSISKGKVFFIL